MDNVDILVKRVWNVVRDTLKKASDQLPKKKGNSGPQTYYLKQVFKKEPQQSAELTNTRTNNLPKITNKEKARLFNPALSI
uniref:Uncharacterized protein n=1 Tax=Rhizophagus irregularis (strain DAOM 181602 / DAOM 197198 / MUCL 43194) TaxID=747089 RepID=U9TNW9_RHIID